MNVLNIINGLLAFGPAVFMPIIIFILGLIVGLKPSRAFRSGLTMGIAFTGILLIITYLIGAQVGPASQAMVKRTGIELSYLDIGWTPAAAIAWSWPIAVIMFPLQIIINIIMLAFGWTKTLNVDMWNVWVKAYLGGLAVQILGANYLIIFTLAGIMVILELKLGDWTANMVQDYMGVPGISIPHSTVFGLLIAAPIDWVVSRIPGIGKIKADPETLRARFGFLGENMTLGLIMGLLLGILAGYDLKGIVQLGVVAAATLTLLPRIAVMFMEALAPLSEAAGEFMKKRFPGREFYIGLDWPILAGHPSTYAAGILFVPITLLLAVIIPGNKTLPFASLGDPWLLSMIGVLVGGDLIRMVIAGIFVIGAYILTATYFAPALTSFATAVGFQKPAGSSIITWIGTSPFNAVAVEIGKLNLASLLWAVILVGLVVIAYLVLKPRNTAARKRLEERGLIAPSVETGGAVAEPGKV
jgi:PTS system galactitol-specific IIC component